MVVMDMDVLDTKTKTNTTCFKDPMYAIFLKISGFKDFKYDMDMDMSDMKDMDMVDMEMVNFYMVDMVMVDVDMVDMDMDMVVVVVTPGAPSFIAETKMWHDACCCLVWQCLIPIIN